MWMCWGWVVGMCGRGMSPNFRYFLICSVVFKCFPWLSFLFSVVFPTCAVIFRYFPTFFCYLLDMFPLFSVMCPLVQHCFSFIVFRNIFVTFRYISGILRFVFDVFPICFAMFPLFSDICEIRVFERELTYNFYADWQTAYQKWIECNGIWWNSIECKVI